MTPLSQDILSTPLYSDFGADDELADLVEMFVAEMPQRISALETLAAAHDWDEVGRTAHQLKGSSGSYGFQQLTPAASRVEEAIRGHEPEAMVLRAVAELLSLCRSVRAGTAETERSC